MSFMLAKEKHIAKANIDGIRSILRLCWEELQSSITKDMKIRRGKGLGAAMQSTTVDFRENKKPLKSFTKMLYHIRLFFS